MASHRKIVSRGTGELENDPEKGNSTQARAPNPLLKPPARPPTSEHPERSYRTGQEYDVNEQDEQGLAADTRLEGDGLEALDPEVGHLTQELHASEEGDQEEDTEADDAEATRTGGTAWLEIIAGPDKGTKQKIKGVRLVIGRTPGVDLLLSDQSVSRRHVELILGDDGVVMKDLGSGNGTKVNGAKVAERKLAHGDEISLGKTTIRFLDEVAAANLAEQEAAKLAALQAPIAPPAEGESQAAEVPSAEPPAEAAKTFGAVTALKGRLKALPRPLKLGVAALGLLLFLSLAAFVFSQWGERPEEVARAAAALKMQEAERAIQGRDFGQAAKLVEEAEKLSPGIDQNNLGLQAREELAVVNALEEAKKALDEARFDDARAALGKAGGDEALAAMGAEIEKAEVVSKKAKIDELLASGDGEGAKAVLAELPVNLQAEPALKIVEFERQLEEQREQDLKAAALAARQNAAHRKERREKEIEEAFLVVERKFAAGEWERAASECSRVISTFPQDVDIVTRARMLQRLIPNFGKHYDEGMKKFRQGTLPQAAKPLRSAHLLYGQLNLRANAYAAELDEKMGAAAVAAGKAALLRDDLVTASQMFKDAQRIDPTDGLAKAALDDIAVRADMLFQGAYDTREADPREAMRKFRIVVQVTDAGSVLHEKAKNQLAAMAP